jgi:dihydrofolate reductase
MGKVITGFSMSLDGFVAGPQDEVDRVFQWYFSGQDTREVASGNEVFKLSSEGAELIEQASQEAGVLVSARRTFDVAKAWGGKHPMNVPVVVLTHHVPQEWVKEGSPFTFVTTGIQSAIEQAQKIAGDKAVVIGAPSVVQQCLQAGLLDEIHIDLAPLLLFEGIRLFDHLGIDPVDLEITEVSANPNVIHLTYRVKK